MNEMGGRPHPDLIPKFKIEMGQSIRRHQAAVGNTAGETKLLRTEQGVAYHRMNSVGTDQCIHRNGSSICEMRFDVVAVIRHVSEAVRNVYPLRRDGARQRAMEIAPMKRIIWSAESALDRLPERGAEQKAAVVPTPLVESQRFDAGPLERVGNPEPMQNARSVRADIDAGPDLAEDAGLLEDLHVESRAQQRGRRRETADAAADDRDRGPACEGHDSPCAYLD